MVDTTGIGGMNIENKVHRSISKCLAGTNHTDKALGYLARGGADVKDAWPYPRNDKNATEKNFKSRIKTTFLK